MLKINILLLLFLKVDGIFFGGGCNCGQSCQPCQSSCSNPCVSGGGGNYYATPYNKVATVSGGGAYAVAGPAAVVGSIPQPVSTIYTSNSDLLPGGRLDGYVSPHAKASTKPPSDSFNGWWNYNSKILNP